MGLFISGKFATRFHRYFLFVYQVFRFARNKLRRAMNSVEVRCGLELETSDMRFVLLNYFKKDRKTKEIQGQLSVAMHIFAQMKKGFTSVQAFLVSICL